MKITKLKLEESFVQYDGTDCSFTAKDDDGVLYFFYMAQNGAYQWSYFAAPVNDDELDKLKNGNIDIRTVLSKSPLWIFHLNKTNLKEHRVLQVNENFRHVFESYYMPKVGVKLYEEN